MDTVQDWLAELDASQQEITRLLRDHSTEPGFVAAISLGAREHNLLTAAHRAGSLTPDLSTALYETLDELARRGQQAGVVRADLVADDLPPLIAMLHRVLFPMDSASAGWRR